jgi:hypothetical protein
LTPAGLEVNELVLTDEVLTPERFEELSTFSELRAFGRTSWGDHAMVAYSTKVAGPGTPTTDLPYCPEGQDCTHYLLELIGRVTPCDLPARAVNVHALVTIRNGGLRLFAEAVADHQDVDADARVAAAFLHGQGPYNAVVEVVGDNVPDVFTLLRTFTDVEHVERVSEHVLLAKDTFGWGGVREQR